MRLHPPLARAHDACAKSGNTLALHIGVCVALEFTESHEQFAGIGRSLLHRLGQPQRRSGAGLLILLRCNVGRSTNRRDAADRRQIALSHLAEWRRHNLQLRRARHSIDRGITLGGQHLEAHAHRVVIGEAQQRRGTTRHLDQPMRCCRSAIIDAHHHRQAVLQVGQPRDRGQLQRLVRRGQRRLVERLAIRGQIRMAARRIHHGKPGLLTFVTLARIIPGAASLIWRTKHIVWTDRNWLLAGPRKQCQRQSERQPHATTASPSSPTTSA